MQISRTAQGRQSKYELLLPRSMQLALLGLLVLNLLPLASQLAIWFIALSALCLLFHLAVYAKLVKRPSRIGRIFIALSGCLLLAITGRELGLLLGMLHLLCFAYLLKPFELNQQRDFYLLVILGLLLLSASFIFQQSIYFALAVAVIVLINFSYLTRYFSQQQGWHFQVKISSKLLVQSLPLTLVLFIAFPKIPPFWQMPSAKSATTGLSDTVKVGDIAQLALSNELAFRVEFYQQVPKYQQMYWRALVLTDFDGRQWSKRHSSFNKRKVFNQQTLARLALGKRKISYQVIAEPSYQHWLFALDVAIAGTSNGEILQLTDYSLFSRQKVNQSLVYQVTSYQDQALTIEVDGLNRYRQIDAIDNPQLSQYGQQLAVQFGDDRSTIIETVLTRFRQQNYRYTLTPPALTNNSLDEFFFTTQAGFCEHYASSFTYLMRAAGIPARLVLGYLGGEYNRQGNYYSVYQRDAHAWSEVWLAGQGWVKVDPTAAVDPSRVERGFSQQLLSEQQQLSPGFNVNRWLGAAWINQLKMQLEAIDYHWTKLVVNYSQQDQHNFLTHWLGTKFQLKTAGIIAITLIIAFSSIWLLQQYRQRRRDNKVVWLSYYKKAHQHLEKLGIVHENQVPDHQFIADLNQQQPLLAQHYYRLLQNFYSLHYQQPKKGQQVELIKAMKQQLRQLQSINRL
ncbi:protein-glutamine gamma-glutamyltransferase [Thalassotalea insulae]|uniref:Protein-glutamine gamma-glutamyltransferase n=1 Tax=Thalassotalea insulae TaxID=2056778 RepID=A0ABQ6GX74_9GAMM|nr:DUF3488 and transglutaminase-like domain-containing protein [Thalassotalea insulae]GLX80457.1 protein-glutamine gamma-glutamyltransferase [Thalassotalea insulae]